MVEERSDHSAVSMGNKMFVIGRNHDLNCEIFDSYSRKFCAFKIKTLDMGYRHTCTRAVCVGNKMKLFYGDNGKVSMCVYEESEKKPVKHLFVGKITLPVLIVLNLVPSFDLRVVFCS